MIAGGEGVYIADSDGKRSLDAFAGLYCVNVGYGRTEIAEAIAKKNGLDRKTLLSLMYYGSIAEDYSRMAAATRKEKPLPYA